MTTDEQLDVAFMRLSTTALMQKASLEAAEAEVLRLRERVSELEAKLVKDEQKHPEAYLGDGVYATFDGYQIWLRHEQDRGGWNSIALDPQVYAALTEYARRVWVVSQP